MLTYKNSECTYILTQENVRMRVVWIDDGESDWQPTHGGSTEYNTSNWRTCSITTLVDLITEVAAGDVTGDSTCKAWLRRY